MQRGLRRRLRLSLRCDFSAGGAHAAWQDSPKVKTLYEAAKKEGKVIVWGTHRREVSWIPAAFGKFFPGITVQVLGDNEIAVKAIARRAPAVTRSTCSGTR